jgi:hypothetical protein
MTGMLQPVMAGPAKIDRRRLLHQEGAIGRVKGMTGAAIPFLDGFVGQITFDRFPLRRRFFLFLLFCKLCLHSHGIRMTLPTEALRIRHEQSFLCGRMGFMAVQAARLIEKGPVDPVFVQHLVHHAAVAGSAQFITYSLCLKRIRRRCRFVALAALTIGHGSMHVGKKDSRLIRAMGVMAGRTIRFGYRIINMLLGKCRSICFMTADAEGDQIGLEKHICFAGAMRIMTVHTSFFHGIMFELHLGNGIADVLMTFNTEGISRLKEDELVIGSMRVVTFYAIPFHYNFMGAFEILW